MNSPHQDGVFIVGIGGQQGTTFARKLRDNHVPIHGTERDPLKLAKFQKEFPDAQLYKVDENGQIALPPGMPTIVASNTPDHKRAIIERILSGTKHILSEKPLALNLDQTVNIISLAKQYHVDLYTALLIRFSPAVAKLRAFMSERDLIMIGGEVDWGKNRIGNSRPTAGDLEDEAVHGMDILFLFASLNQNIESMEVVGVLEFQKYVDDAIQSSMNRQDPSYPLFPNSSTKAITVLDTTYARIRTLIQSSFVAPTERRNVTLQLARRTNPDLPLFSARMDFDKRGPVGIKDTLQVWDLQNTKNQIPLMELDTDKLGDQTKAWLDTIAQKNADPRLATTHDALNVARWSDAVSTSHNHHSKNIQVEMSH